MSKPTVGQVQGPATQLIIKNHKTWATTLLAVIHDQGANAPFAKTHIDRVRYFTRYRRIFF
jgi:hypothetical protein